MATIRDLRDGIRKVNFNSMVVNAADKTKDKLVQFNREQLLQGRDSRGLLLSPEYASFNYALRKYQQNAAPGFGNPDLYLTGAFQRAFYATVGYTGIYTLDSTDSKTDVLQNGSYTHPGYGKYIFGVNTQNIEKYAQENFWPEFQTQFTAKTGLRFN